jgi:APA family basic amino acid/polyamine antiporter
MKRLVSFRRDQSGVGALEFALIAPALLGMLVGITQLGALYFARSAATSASSARPSCRSTAWSAPGIFALPGTLYDKFGAFSPFLFPLFGLLVLIVACRSRGWRRTTRCRAARSSTPPPSARRRLPGGLDLLCRPRRRACRQHHRARHLSRPLLAGARRRGVPRAAVILAVCGLLTAINIVGVKRAVRLLDALTLLKAAPLILVAILGLVVAGGAIEAPGPPPPLTRARGRRAAHPLCLRRLRKQRRPGRRDGRSAAHHPARADRHHPRHRRALFPGPALLRGGDGAGRRAATRRWSRSAPPLMGPAGGILLTAAAVFSLLGNISGGMTGTTRTTYAMGRDGLLPAWFGG